MFSKRHMKRLVKNEENKFYGEAPHIGINENAAISTRDLEDSGTTMEGSENVIHNIDFLQDAGNWDRNDWVTLLDKLIMWSVEHKVTRNCFDALLAILQSENIDVPRSSKSVLAQTKCLLRTVAPGRYLHIGLQNQLRTIAATLTDLTEFVIDIGIDGLPLYKSSSVCLWPILAKLYPQRNTKVMLLGVFEGKQKPANANVYLHDLAYELKPLLQYGIEVEGRTLMLKVRSFICDAPARAFICQTVGHSAFQGCNKCTQVGRRVNSTTVFSTVSGSLRTDEDFASRTSVDYHKNGVNDRSCLEEIGIGMVSAFPIEPMHLIDLGVVKKMLICLINGPNAGFQLRKEQKQKLSATLLSYISYIPNDFARRPRCLDEIARWKAVEFRQFILYTGVVALKKIVSDDIYYHFCLLHCAYSLLSSEKQYEGNLQAATDMINYFVLLFPNFYGEQKVSYNVHAMLHLVDCVKSCGFLNSFAAYAFENFMQHLKRFVKRPRECLQQISNRYQYETLFTKNRFVGPKDNRHGIVVRFYARNFNVTNKFPDNFCYIKAGVGLQITIFSKEEDKVLIHGKILKDCCNFFSEPLKSMSDLGIFVATIDNEETTEIYDVKHILYKLICLPYDSCPCKIAALERKFDTSFQEMNNKIDEMAKKIHFISGLVEKLITAQSSNNVILNALQAKNQTILKFPINTEENLQQWESDIEYDKAKYISAIQELLRPHGIHKSIQKIIGTQILIKYNYFGVKGKKCFKNFKNINNVLFECIKTEGMTESDYAKDIQKSFKLAKGRFFKTQCATKKGNEGKEPAI